MKNILIPAVMACLSVNFAAADPVVLVCQNLSGNGTMSLTISGDGAGDALSAHINETQTGLTYSEDGIFRDFENQGTEAVYTVSDGESETTVDVSLITGSSTSGAVSRHIIGFSGGPGEEGWPDQRYNYSCSR